MGGFHGLQSLISLYLSSNVISIVEPGSFEGLSSLIRLSLTGNNIAAIYPETFMGLKLYRSTLEELYLGNNRITVIQKNAFEGFTVLDYLGLENNQISEINSGGFHGLSSLTHIDFEHNSLTTLEWTAFSSTCGPPPGKYYFNLYILIPRLIFNVHQEFL